MVEVSVVSAVVVGLYRKSTLERCQVVGKRRLTVTLSRTFQFCCSSLRSGSRGGWRCKVTLTTSITSRSLKVEDRVKKMICWLVEDV